MTSNTPSFKDSNDQSSLEHSTELISEKIRSRLIENNVSYFANDNLSKYIEDVACKII